MNKLMAKFAVLIGLLCATMFASRAQDSIPNLLTNGQYVYKLYGSNVMVLQNGTQPSSASQIANVLGQALAVTNWVLEAGGGTKLSGHGTYMAEGAVIYNFNENIGVLLGYKEMWDTGQNGLKTQNQASVLKGGATLSYPIPMSFDTNIVVVPNMTVAVSTPTKGTSNLGGVGLDSGFGGSVNFQTWGRVKLHTFVEYINSAGQGTYSGNYLTGGLAVSMGL